MSSIPALSFHARLRVLLYPIIEKSTAAEQEAALLECSDLAKEFERLTPDEMAEYLSERPDPKRWDRISANVHPHKRMWVKELADLVQRSKGEE
jgi:uncharacterized iron-regulated membrane protein